MIPTIDRLSPKQASDTIERVAKLTTLDRADSSLLLAAVATIDTVKRSAEGRDLISKLVDLPIIVQTKGAYDHRRRPGSIRSALASVALAPFVIRINVADSLEQQVRSLIQEPLVGKRAYGEHMWFNECGDQRSRDAALRDLMHNQAACVSMRTNHVIVSLYSQSEGSTTEYILLTAAGMRIQTRRTTTVRKEGSMLYLGNVSVSLALTDRQQRPPLIDHTVANSTATATLMANACQRIEQTILGANVTIDTEEGRIENVIFTEG